MPRLAGGLISRGLFNNVESLVLYDEMIMCCFCVRYVLFVSFTLLVNLFRLF